MTFSLDEEDYGIGILKVKEIIGLMPVTKIPRMKPFIKGVVNLRGKVIPVIDLRARFGLEEGERTVSTPIEKWPTLPVENWSTSSTCWWIRSRRSRTSRAGT